MKLRVDRIIKVSVIFILVLVTIIVGIRGCYKGAEKLKYSVEYTDLVEKYSKEYGVDEILIYAVIKTESGFDPKARSSENALGLTQILPMTFDWIKLQINDGAVLEDLYEPETSIKYGVWFLDFLLDKYENTETAIAAYHAGPGQVSEWLENSEYSDDGKTLKKIPFKDTNYYVEKVTEAYDAYKEILK